MLLQAESYWKVMLHILDCHDILLLSIYTLYTFVTYGEESVFCTINIMLFCSLQYPGFGIQVNAPMVLQCN